MELWKWRLLTFYSADMMYHLLVNKFTMLYKISKKVHLTELPKELKILETLSFKSLMDSLTARISHQILLI
jgi:hypothetical protein